MIEITLANWLRAEASITNITPHVYAITMSGGDLYPAIKVTRLISTPETTFDGLTGEESATIQVDYWATNPADLIAIKKALTTFFEVLKERKANVTGVFNLRERPNYEPDDNIFKQTLELTLDYKET